ncbi:MAG TPA: MoaD/ThiS family protein [Planctomycetaceae bacterium]|nr:MoaD/ThiS family protein [Planctomycetaceae bacterium]
MQIRMRYEAQARRACGIDEEIIELPESSRVSDCIRHVAQRHAETLGPIVLNADGEIQPTLLIFRGDEQVVRNDPGELTDGETISILTPISGG